MPSKRPTTEPELSIFKATMAANTRRWRERHPEAVENDRERHRIYCQEYYRRNRDRLKAHVSCRYRERREDVLAQCHIYYRANREKIIRDKNEYRKRFPDKARAATNLRRARRAGVLNVPFTDEQLRQRLSMYGHLCWMCSGTATTIDHVIPIALGGPHVLANLRPACRPCNSRKGAKRIPS
jgi:5-methylcytosine-specific restriction endonuclease McrA